MYIDDPFKTFSRAWRNDINVKIQLSPSQARPGQDQPGKSVTVDYFSFRDLVCAQRCQWSGSLMNVGRVMNGLVLKD